MTDRMDARTGNRSSASRVAHVVERVGLALAGALCGLFAAALLARADVEMLGPVDLTLAMMLVGIIGFYVGIDMPMRRSRGGFGHIEPGPKVDFAELFSAVGVFLATATALVSVCVVVSDGILPAIWVFGIGGSEPRGSNDADRGGCHDAHARARPWAAATVVHAERHRPTAGLELVWF